VIVGAQAFTSLADIPPVQFISYKRLIIALPFRIEGEIVYEEMGAFPSDRALRIEDQVSY
jgi:hypothetical protein